MFHVRARQLPFKLCNLVQRYNTHSSNRSDSTASDTAEDGAKSINNINNSTLNHASNVERTPSINAETRQGNSAGPSAVGKGSTTALTPPKAPKEVSEVRIPVPWGHIAGKWWGSPDVQPLIGIHDWHENAASFDNLVPLLDVASFLAIDLVGHGLSSHYPAGLCYHYIDQVINIRRIATHYRWDKIDIIGHGIGSSIGFTYAGLFPGEVSKLIGIDCTRGEVRHNDDKRITKELANKLESNILNEGNLTREQTSYRYTDILEDFINKHPDLSKNSCEILLKRALEKTDEGGYRFTTDPRVKDAPLRIHSKELVASIAGHITSEVLDLRTDEGMNNRQEKLYQNTIKAMEMSAKYLELRTVDGPHRVHLTNPGQIAQVINQFIAKKH